MKLSSLDYAILQRAADVADAQREFLEHAKRRSAPSKSSTISYGAVLAALAAIALASLVTLTSLA
jgi:hypothetical protein